MSAHGIMSSFFFSSRRRHTRCGRDWSSDVCSSDLIARRIVAVAPQHVKIHQISENQAVFPFFLHQLHNLIYPRLVTLGRSEERRVGKEGRCWGSPEHVKEE